MTLKIIDWLWLFDWDFCPLHYHQLVAPFIIQSMCPSFQSQRRKFSKILENPICKTHRPVSRMTCMGSPIPDECSEHNFKRQIRVTKWLSAVRQQLHRPSRLQQLVLVVLSLRSFIPDLLPLNKIVLILLIFAVYAFSTTIQLWLSHSTDWELKIELRASEGRKELLIIWFRYWDEANNNDLQLAIVTKITM